MASFTPDGATDAAARHQPGRDPGGAPGRAQHPRRSRRACRASRFATSTRASWRRSGARAPSPSWGGCACPGCIAWLAWVFVHLWYLVGFRNRVVGVHQLDLGLRHLAPRRARDHRTPRVDAATRGSGQRGDSAWFSSDRPMRSSDGPKLSRRRPAGSRPLAPKALDPVRDADGGIGRSCRRTPCTNARSIGHGPVSGDARLPPLDRVGRRRARDRRDDDLLVGKRLQRAELRRRSSATGVSMPRPRPSTHPSSVTRRVHVAVRRQPGRLDAVAQVAELVAAEVRRRAERRREGRCSARVESSLPGGAEQSSSSVSDEDRTGRRRGAGSPGSPAGGRAAVGAERARDRRQLVLEAAARLADRGDAREHVREVAGVVPVRAVVGDEGRAGREVGRGAGRRAACTGRCRSSRRSRRSRRSIRRPRPCRC